MSWSDVAEVDNVEPDFENTVAASLDYRERGGIIPAMPLYEYYCEPCDHAFEALIRSAGEVAHCPRCGSMEVAKQLSVPAAHVGRGQSGKLPICGDTGAPAYGCGRPQCGAGMCAGLD